jgi:hypothetical protein
MDTNALAWYGLDSTSRRVVERLEPIHRRRAEVLGQVRQPETLHRRGYERCIKRCKSALNNDFDRRFTKCTRGM